ncbi:MAG: hypothetical protein ACOYJ1_05955 [Peptococcales bacterium]|jgi:hypothetical protein
MRRVRGGRNKDLGLFDNVALVVKDDWLTYLLVFLCALAGTLIGILIGKVASLILILVILFFLGLMIAGLLTAWSVNRKNQLLEVFSFREGLKEQYNALVLIINELEDNLAAEDGSQVQNRAWLALQDKYAYFPMHIYEDLSHTYACFKNLAELDIIEYRRIIIDELNLPGLISQLKDWQQKIKQQLPYLA